MQISEITGQLSDSIIQMRGEMIVSRGRIHHLRELPGYIAKEDDKVLGLIFYHIENGECEIVALNSYRENVGIGTRLIELVKEKAINRLCRRLWLITTNDNIRAIRFYQMRGFDMRGIHHDAVSEARKIKPSIPLYSPEGIPIKHEVEFEIHI